MENKTYTVITGGGSYRTTNPKREFTEYPVLTDMAKGLLPFPEDWVVTSKKECDGKIKCGQCNNCIKPIT